MKMTAGSEYLTNKHIYDSKTLLPLRAVMICVLFLFLLSYSHARILAKDYMITVKNASKLSITAVVKRGDGFYDKGEQEKALVYYMVVCNRYQPYMNEADKQMCATAHLKAGNIYYHHGNYANALEFYVKGLKIYETCDKQTDIARFYNNIGNVYCIFQDFEKGMSYYKTGYTHSIKNKDSKNEYKLLSNMAGICTFQGNTADARKYHRLSEKLKDPANKVSTFMHRFNLGLIFVTEKRYGKADKLFREQIEYARRNNLESKYLCAVYEQMYKLFDKTAANDSMLAYLDRCEKEAVTHGILHSYPDVYRGYSRFYEKTGDMRLSNTYLAKYVKLKDSIYNMREFDIVKNTQFQYEMDKTNKQIAEFQTNENKRLETIAFQRYMLIGISVVALIVAMFLIFIYKQKKKLNKSYNDLFVINRDFITQHELIKQRLRKLNEENENVRKENMQLRQAACAEHGGSDMTETGKYLSSNLNDNQKKILVDAVVNIMENTTEFCSPDFSLDRMAELVGSNSKYVSQVINDTFHKNFTNYVNEYRIHLACLRLSDRSRYGNLTIRAVAESTGFNSYTAFISVFRKVTGITPSLYQKKAMEDNTYDNRQ